MPIDLDSRFYQATVQSAQVISLVSGGTKQSSHHQDVAAVDFGLIEGRSYLQFLRGRFFD